MTNHLLPHYLPYIWTYINPLQQKIIDALNAKGFHDASSEFLAGILLNTDPSILEKVDTLLIVEALPDSKESRAQFHVIIQDALIDTLQGCLENAFSKSHYQTYAQPSPNCDAYRYRYLDNELICFLLMRRASHFQQQNQRHPNVIQAITDSTDLNSARLTMSHALRQLTQAPNAEFFRVTENKIKTILASYPNINPRIRQQITEDMQQLIHLLNNINNDHEQKLSLIQTYKHNMTHLFSIESQRQIAQILLLVLLTSIVITAATIALGITLSWWTLNGFMLAVTHPFIYVPSSIAITSTMALKAHSIFKQNETLDQEVQDPLEKLATCEAAWCRPS